MPNYVSTGALGIIWFIVWMAVVHESPAVHPRISAWEKQHIITGIGSSQDKINKVKNSKSLDTFLLPLPTVNQILNHQ